MKDIIKKNKNYTYEILKNDIEFLKYEYPCIKIGDIGESVLGEKIKYIKLGNGTKKVFINASHHANEWLTSLTIMIFVEKYLKAYSQKQNYKGYNVEEMWNKSSIYIVPMVNPDGVNLCLKDKNVMEEELYKPIWKRYETRLYKWKSNIRGVDLKNYQHEKSRVIARITRLFIFDCFHSLMKFILEKLKYIYTFLSLSISILLISRYKYILSI